MNTLLTIARQAREHYIRQFSDEYETQLQLVSQMNRGVREGSDPFRLVTDCETTVNDSMIETTGIAESGSRRKSKLYRYDMVIFRDQEPLESILCWPVHVYEEEGTAEEDIACFPPFVGIIKQTEVDIRPFPWFHCTLAFYPEAEAMKGIMDMWFYRWFYRQGKPEPFMNVIHRMDGPFSDHDEGEVYTIDFGTAPPEAFHDLIQKVCRSDVRRLLIT